MQVKFRVSFVEFIIAPIVVTSVSTCYYQVRIRLRTDVLRGEVVTLEHIKMDLAPRLLLKLPLNFILACQGRQEQPDLIGVNVAFSEYVPQFLMRC